MLPLVLINVASIVSFDTSSPITFIAFSLFIQPSMAMMIFNL
nr:MAG TPA: hypothetical protein [Inoviridae sp.]